MTERVDSYDIPSSASSDGGSDENLSYPFSDGNEMQVTETNGHGSVGEDNVSLEMNGSGSNHSLNNHVNNHHGSETSRDSVRSPKGPGKTSRKERDWTHTKSTILGTKSHTILRSGQRTIYTSGRPPWYNVAGQLVEPIIIGICGGSASGKTTVARSIIETLDVPWVTLLSMDSFYKVFSAEDKELVGANEFNFDSPDAFDFDLLIETLGKLREGKRVDVPIYNFVTHSREKRTRVTYGANVIIVEGILTFYHQKLLDMMDMKVFIDTHPDVRLARRLKRDIAERGRDLEGVMKQYNTFVKPSFENFIAPTVIHADIIVPRGGENQIAINLIVQHIHKQLQSKGAQLRSKLLKSHLNQPRPDSLKVLPVTSQIKGIHTIIRNRETSRDEFIFYSKRLMRLLIEFALSQLPLKDSIIETPQGVEYHGKRADGKKICGVSILRAGETMEQALKDVVKDARLGKICIQTNTLTNEPELIYLRLPKDIKDYRIMVMDATVATGAAAMMAIRVLLDHDVPEENIILCSLLMAESGVHTIAYAFPKVVIITTEVDPEVNDQFYIVPGIGNFGDRYFGTESFGDELLQTSINY